MVGQHARELRRAERRRCPVLVDERDRALVARGVEPSVTGEVEQVPRVVVEPPLQGAPAAVEDPLDLDRAGGDEPARAVSTRNRSRSTFSVGRSSGEATIASIRSGGSTRSGTTGVASSRYLTIGEYFDSDRYSPARASYMNSQGRVATSGAWMRSLMRTPLPVADASWRLTSRQLRTSPRTANRRARHRTLRPWRPRATPCAAPSSTS